MKWISVKDRLPEIGKRVLCYCKDEINIYSDNDYKVVAWLRENGGWWDGGGFYLNPTHWMELPGAPD